MVALPPEATKLKAILLQLAAKLFDAGKAAPLADVELMTAYNAILTGAALEQAPWQIQQVAADFDTKDNQVRQALSNNIASFSAAKTLEVIQQMTQLLITDDNKIKPFSQFKRDVLEIEPLYNVNYLKTEYNDVIADAQITANLVRYNEQIAAMPYLICRTAGDDRVRGSHSAMDGVCRPVAEWTIAPPFDHNCRCDLEQTNDPNLLSDQFERQAALDGLKMKAQFKQDPLKGRVFNGHPYFKSHNPNELKRTDYSGLKSMDEVYQRTGTMANAGKAVAFDKAWKTLKAKKGLKGKDAIVLKDKNANSYRVDSTIVNRSDRANLLSDTLAKPSEVWTKDGSVAHIKFFKETTTVLVSDAKGKATTFVTFGPGEKAVDNYRKGILKDRN
jgi:hypothetical protein